MADESPDAHAMPADESVCPHIDLNDPRCGAKFTLTGVTDAFGICCGGQHGCAIFHRINMEIRFRAAARDGSQGAAGRGAGAPAAQPPFTAPAMPTADGRALRIRP